jgi:Raf kinase inhibitor-like YbhB/YbcL family protein
MTRFALLVPLALLVFGDPAPAADRLKVRSKAFKNGKKFPQTFTADGKNISPPLEWTPGPKGTQSYALICDDPDAPRGVFVHWVIFNIPAKTHQLTEGAKPSESGARQGRNSRGKMGYMGPAPPKGKPHHYHFKVYALDKTLGLKAGATKKQLQAAMKGHVLAKGEIVGLYGRR